MNTSTSTISRQRFYLCSVNVFFNQRVKYAKWLTPFVKILPCVWTEKQQRNLYACMATVYRNPDTLTIMLSNTYLQLQRSESEIQRQISATNLDCSLLRTNTVPCPERQILRPNRLMADHEHYQVSKKFLLLNVSNITTRYTFSTRSETKPTFSITFPSSTISTLSPVTQQEVQCTETLCQTRAACQSHEPHHCRLHSTMRRAHYRLSATYTYEPATYLGDTSAISQMVSRTIFYGMPLRNNFVLH